MFKFFFVILLSFPLFAGSLSLYDLAFLVSKSSNKSVIFSKDVNQKIKIIVSDTPVDYLPLFKQALLSNGYQLKTDKTFFYVSVPNVDKKDGGIFSPITNMGFSAPNGLKSPPPMVSNDVASGGIAVVSNGHELFNSPIFSTKNSASSDRNNSFDNVPFTFKTLSLTYLKPSDLNETLVLSGFDYSVSLTNKVIIFKVPDNKIKLFNNLSSAIHSIDIPPQQISLKITVFSSDNSKLRDLGFSPSLNFDTNVSFVSPNKLVGDLIGSFYSSLHFLETKGATNITNNPIFFVSDNEQLDFKSVVNIAFLDDTTTVTSQTGTNQSTRYTYKPIGFKVLITPTIVQDTVYLDFYISFEDILSSGDRPTTSEKSIKNKFSLKKGELILLAGISQNKVKDFDEKLPFISDIPYIGNLFKRSQKNDENTFFNISIEVLK